jgi:ubiquinone/menaquinone biosynthesis C-methylase UbiE
MSITNAPFKLAWRTQEFLYYQIVYKIPFLRARYEQKQVDEIFELARIAVDRSFPVKVLDSGWANQGCLTNKGYGVLTGELVEICRVVGAFVQGIPMALHWSRQYEYPYAIMNSLPPEHPSGNFRILDCGAGIGPLQFYFAMKGYNTYTLDLDLPALERVARFKSEKKLESLHPTFGNVLKLPFPDSYFDRVTNISVLEHVIYLVKQDTNVILKGFVNEMLRVLKPKGLVVLTFDVNMDPKKSDLRLYFHEYESLCKTLGTLPTSPPASNLFSSDTKEGRMMGEDLCTYCAILTHDSFKCSRKEET